MPVLDIRISFGIVDGLVVDLLRQENAYTFLSKTWTLTPATIDAQVTQRIAQRGAGAVFTPADFLDLGSRNAVDLALSRRVRVGTIRRLARGLYDAPRTDTALGLLAPSTDDVANALRDRDGARLQAAGAHAAHLLDLSDQVPVRAVFLTDGRSRTVRLGRRQIVLKHTTPKQMATAGESAAR